MEDTRVVTVEISGQRYPIRSHLDAGYVAQLAGFVEERMKLAASECPAGDTLKIAVLAALNIADECFRTRDTAAAGQNRLSSRTQALEQMLDAALGLRISGDDDATSGQEAAAPVVPALARAAGSF